MAAGAGPAHAMYFAALEEVKAELVKANIPEHIGSGRSTLFDKFKILIKSVNTFFGKKNNFYSSSYDGVVAGIYLLSSCRNLVTEKEILSTFLFRKR